MMRTTTASLARRAAGATTLLLVVAACSSGAKDDTRTDTTAATAAPAAATTPSPATAPAPETTPATAPAAASGMLDPNSATRDQLVAVPGMTPAAADALIAGRPYQDMVAVDKVLAKSLAADARKTVYAKLWKPIDLNTAADAEILLIPGVGPRMLREFKEYRPYKAIETFGREMGKYVDKAEVARLEQYVTIR